MDSREFKKVVFGICTELNASPGKVVEPEVIPNFWGCELEHQEFSLNIICSEDGEWALVESYDPTVCELKFMDNDKISKVLSSSFGITLNSKSKLDRDFIALPTMSKSDIKYWRPETLGQGMFNWWD